jgi:hypothetical protein
MFATSERHKHPLSSVYGGETQLWRAVEIELRRQWFLVEVEMPDMHQEEGGAVRRTICISSVDDVLGLASTGTGVDSVLRSVSVVEPSLGMVTGWTMHSVKEIWEAEEPEDRSLKTRIVVKTSGEPCSLSMFGTPADAMHDWKKVADFSSTRS